MPNLGTLQFGVVLRDETAQQAEQIKKNIQSRLRLDGIKVGIDRASLNATISQLRTELSARNFKINIGASMSGASASSWSKIAAQIPKMQELTRILEQQNTQVRELVKNVGDLATKYGMAGRGANMFGKSLMGMFSGNAVSKADALSSKMFSIHSSMEHGISIAGRYGAAIGGIYSVYLAKQFLDNIIEIGGQLEQQRISIGAILGDISQANTMFEQIKGLAVKSPFGVLELDQYSKQLTAYGFQYNELYDTVKRLADISAGAGTDFGRLANALGHVRAQTYLNGITLRMFSMNNVPMLRMLSEYYTELEKRMVSVGEVQQRISKRQVSYDDVIEQIRRMTDEGGMFYHMQEEISTGLAAKFKNLRDSFDIMYGEIAESGFGDLLKGFAEGMLNATRQWRTVGTAITAAAATYGAIRIAQAAYAAGARVVAINNIAVAGTMGAVKTAGIGLELMFRRVGAAMKSILFNPVTMIIAGVEAATLVWMHYSEQIRRIDEMMVSLKEHGVESAAAIRKSLENTTVLADRVNTEGSNGATEIRIDTATMQHDVDEMERIIRDYAENAGDIIDKAFGPNEQGKIMDLKERYEYLRGEVEKLLDKLDNQDNMGVANIVGGALKASGGWLNDDLITNINDYVENLNDYDDAFKKFVADHRNEVDVWLAKAKEVDENFRKDTEGMTSYVEQLKLLSQNRQKYSAAYLSVDMHTGFWEAMNPFSNYNQRTMVWVNQAEQRMHQDIVRFVTYLKSEVEEMKPQWESAGIDWAAALRFGIEKTLFTQENVAKWGDELTARIRRNVYDPLRIDYSDLGKELEPPKHNSGGSNDHTSASKRDKQLEEAKTRLEEVRSFLTEYKKYREIYSREKSIDLLEDLFPTTKGKGATIVDDYKKSVSDVINGLEATTEARKKFRLQGQKLIADYDFNKQKQSVDDAKSAMNEYIQRTTEQYKLYKKLLAETGDKNFAEMALRDGHVWDDASNRLREKLKEALRDAGQSDAVDELWGMSKAQAKEYFKDVNGGYELWQKIVDLLHDGYTSGLEQVSKAMSDIMTSDEKILKLEAELAKLREENADEALIKAKEKELSKEKTGALKESNGYLNFYSAILTMGVKEAEEMGRKIRANLNQELRDGTISARQYLTEVKKINEQLSKLRNAHGGLSAFLSGGIDGYLANRKDVGDSQWQRGINDLQQFEKDFEAASKAFAKARSEGDSAGMAQAEAQMKASEEGIAAAQAMQEGGMAMSEGAGEAMATIAIIDKIVHGINNLVHGIKESFDEIKETAEYMGKDTTTDKWQDQNAFWSSFSNASSSATKAWEGLKSGNIGDLLSGVIGSFTNWYTGFAKAHDAKLERQIQLAEDQLDAVNRLRSAMETRLEATLGGVYGYKSTADQQEKMREAMDKVHEENAKSDAERAKTSIGKGLWKSLVGGMIGMLGGFIGAAVGSTIGGIVGNVQGAKTDKITSSYYSEDTIRLLLRAMETESYYDAQLALLYTERDELARELEAMNKKKKKDQKAIDEKTDEYTAKLQEIEQYALQMADSIYSINLKTWANSLTEAVVSAWEKGEDAAEAYKRKVQELMGELATNIMTQQIMEIALKNSGIEEYITKMMNANSGLLNVDEAVAGLTSLLIKAGDTAAPAIEAALTALEQSGLYSRGESTGSSMSGSIKSITESQADILASYLNAIRADVSVERGDVAAIRLLLEGQNGGSGSTIAEMQVFELRNIASYTMRTAVAAERLEGYLRMATLDKGSGFFVK